MATGNGLYLAKVRMTIMSNGLEGRLLFSHAVEMRARHCTKVQQVDRSTGKSQVRTKPRLKKISEQCHTLQE